VSDALRVCVVEMLDQQKQETVGVCAPWENVKRKKGRKGKEKKKSESVHHRSMSGMYCIYTAAALFSSSDLFSVHYLYV
jgi:hypothetical protein